MDETQTEITENKEQESTVSNSENGISGQNEGISPLEEARKINEDNKKLYSQMTAERIRIEKAAAELLVNGRTFAGQQEKKDDPAKKMADDIVSAFH